MSVIVMRRRLRKLHDVTLVVGSPVEGHVRRASAPFRTIEVVRMPILERVFDWSFRTFLRSNYDTQLLTALMYPFSLAFEWRAWRQLRRRILEASSMPFCASCPCRLCCPVRSLSSCARGLFRSCSGRSMVVCALRPASASLTNKELGFAIRKLSRFLPFARSTYRHAAAIIVASSHMRTQFAAYSDKLFFVPENGIPRSLCCADARSPESGAKLDLIFVGGLVPRKACYLGLRAAAPLLRGDLAHFTVIGDGPERGRPRAAREVPWDRECC